MLDAETFKSEQTSWFANRDGYGSVGFNTESGPMICGGRFSDEGICSKSCYLYSAQTKSWTPSVSLTTARFGASVIRINANEVLIMGGYDKNYKDLDTMEIVSTSGSRPAAATLPFRLRAGCVTKLNDTTGIIMGGFQDGSQSDATHYINLNTLETTSGPRLNLRRVDFGCATTPQNKVIVTGGKNSNYATDVTEIMDPSKPKHFFSWSIGKKL